MKKLTCISFGLILMVMTTSTLAQDGVLDTTRWSPELALQYVDITETAISPDGNHVAYVTGEPVMDNTTSEFRQQIHVAASNGSSDVQYTRGR